MLQRLDEQAGTKTRNGMNTRRRWGITESGVGVGWERADHAGHWRGASGASGITARSFAASGAHPAGYDQIGVGRNAESKHS